MSSKGHEGPCGPCALCKKQGQKYKHFGALSLEVQHLILRNKNTPIPENACICYPCAKQCERNKSKADFKPRWLQKKTKGNCSIESCKSPWHSNTNLVSASELEQVLNERLVAFSVAEPGTSIGLCREHYNALYTQLHTSQQCASCGAKPKRGESFTRHIPEPDLINTHMESISDDHQLFFRFRFAQCLRRYRDTRLWFPHLVNAGKTPPPSLSFSSLLSPPD